MVATVRKASALPDADVVAIRASEQPTKELVRIYGHTPEHINGIRRGDKRKDYASAFAGLGARA